MKRRNESGSPSRHLCAFPSHLKNRRDLADRSTRGVEEKKRKGQRPLKHNFHTAVTLSRGFTAAPLWCFNVIHSECTEVHAEDTHYWAPVSTSDDLFGHIIYIIVVTAVKQWANKASLVHWERCSCCWFEGPDNDIKAEASLSLTLIQILEIYYTEQPLSSIIEMNLKMCHTGRIQPENQCVCGPKGLINTEGRNEVILSITVSQTHIY